MKFKLEIELGNVAMSSRHQVAWALKHVAGAIIQYRLTKDAGKIMDVNGNSVGKWEFEGEPGEEVKT